MMMILVSLMGFVDDCVVMEDAKQNFSSMSNSSLLYILYITMMYI